MFLSFLASENQKLVHTWKDEHKKIVVLAHKVIEEYSTNHHDEAKKALIELNEVTVHHLMVEDIELYRIKKDEEGIDEDALESVDEFVKSFKETKMSLMKFLTKYTKPEVELDEKFFNTFNNLVGILAKRIAFEEKNLYSKLDK